MKAFSIEWEDGAVVVVAENMWEAVRKWRKWMLAGEEDASYLRSEWREAWPEAIIEISDEVIL